ncbi:hypothetical protein N0V93_001418 [Gnomoniopsis smithogilvyi]|uniref:Ppe family protein n=1 Tax=Gnomoniopsis smithogilvyi TaxID=1191159 RepID=A0A9W8Z222_9PEZI|nr:hypothetical protein N0V93_001418 [Gnomoniopsis smithogilvyi]
MKVFLAITTVMVLPAALARPILPVAITSNEHLLTARNFFTNAINGAKGKGAGGNQQQAVTNAASSFAGDVAIVSSSLNSMGNTTDPATMRTLARKAYVAEKDEDQHRAVLNGAASGSARQANQKIVDNTPIVLDGLQSIMVNPSMANTMRNLARVESARNANILPSITALSNSAFQQAGVNQQAQQFAPTTGTSSLRTLQANGAEN